MSDCNASPFGVHEGSVDTGLGLGIMAYLGAQAAWFFEKLRAQSEASNSARIWAASLVLGRAPSRR